MSETSKASMQRTSRYIIIGIVGVSLLAFIGYFAGSLVLPGSIKSAYQEKDCQSVLKLDNTYRSIYPANMTSKRPASLVNECAVYTLAMTSEQRGAWRDSYHAFSVYSETYPSGLFTDEAHRQGAVGLLSLTKEEITQKKYLEAAGNLNTILVDYKDTDVVTEAVKLFPEIYMAWGEDLRAGGDFTGAERTFNDYKVWAESNRQAEHVQTAQAQLAQTYLVWGTALQAQQKFDDAQAKFDLAVSLNPDFAEQIQSGQMELYRQQGDYLIEQGDFAGAMERYETAAALSKSNDPASASDIIANGFVQWASGLTAEEDYLGALVLLDFAQTNAATNSAKTGVDNARSDLYLMFSKSVGAQAQKAMEDAVRIFCEHHIQPRLPIFGLNKDTILAGIYGIEDNKLPENLVATTPAELHYVVCIEETIKVIGSVRHNLYASAAGFQPYLFERFQYTWVVILRETDTGAETASTTIHGAEPPPFPTNDFEIYTAAFNGETQYRGPKPDFGELVAWLSTTLK